MMQMEEERKKNALLSDFETDERAQRNGVLEKEKEERQLDMMMEIERLKALKMYEEREKTKAEDQRRGASVIVEQIKDRQAVRMREEEHRDQERIHILRQIEALKEEEVEQQKAKKVAAARLMEEVNEANSASRLFHACR